MNTLQCCEHSKTVTLLAVSLELGVSVDSVHDRLISCDVSPASHSGLFHCALYYSLDVRQAYGDWRPRHKWS